MKNFVLGSHNSFSYLKTKNLLLRPFSFMARCQNVDIIKQYRLYNVRCFDLRIRFNKKGNLVVAHGAAVYKINKSEVENYLNIINNWKDCYVRILLEVRNKKQYNKLNKDLFVKQCKEWESKYKNIKFWCGRNLYNWNVEYKFNNNPTCEELYSSVCSPKLIDDWYPKIYAKKNNKKNIQKGTNKDILLIDFVNIR